MSRKAFFLFLLFFVLCMVGFGYSEDSSEPAQSTKRAPKTTPPRLTVKPVIKPSPTPTPMQIGKDLVKNGNLDIKNPKHDSPMFWQLCDGLTSFFEKEESRGYVLRFDTAVPKEEARERWLVMKDKGINAPPAAKKGKLKGIYSSIGAFDGIHFYSDAIPVKGGARYKLYADIRGKTKAVNYAKIFVKGYGTISKIRKIRQPDGTIKEVVVKEVRQIFKWYLAMRDVKTTWKEYADWIPCEMPRKVEFVKICLFPYWPNGEYYFDNIKFYEGKLPPEKK